MTGHLRPQQWDGTTDLNVGGYNVLRGALHDQQLLCLYKVSDSALQVYSALAALSLLLHAHASVRPFCEQGGSLKSAHMGSAAWHR